MVAVIENILNDIVGADYNKRLQSNFNSVISLSTKVQYTLHFNNNNNLFLQEED